MHTPDPRWCARLRAHGPAPDPAPPPPGEADDEACDVCGSAHTFWRNCKLICRDCKQIVKSCADL